MRSPALALGIAILFGALAAFLARGLIQGQDQRGGAAAQTAKVVVASGPIAFGATLSASNLREVNWPTGDVMDGAFPTMADLLRDGRRLALAPMQRNEPVLASKITAPNQRATLSTQIDEGMRAVTVRVDDVRGVAGFVLPGDRVDVILTRGEGGTQPADASADLLLQNTKVLAVDQLANERQDKPTVARAVTLELSVEQAQKVILAQGVGRLSLILRQVGEVDSPEARRVTAADLTTGGTAAAIDQAADLKARLEEARKLTEQASARAAEATTRQLSELEARLRSELSRPPAAFSVAPAAPPAPAERPSPSLTVNVTRNGTKREAYTVRPED